MTEGLILWALQVVFAAAIGALFKYAADLRREDREERRKMWKEITENQSRTSVLESQRSDHAYAIERLSTQVEKMGEKIDTKLSEIPTRIVELLNARRDRD